MIEIRRARDRGRTAWDWLDSRHSFSFGEYHDATRTGFRTLRVVNDDRVAPGAGFGTHGHRDMEILSYVLEGAIEHQDSLGHGSIVKPGEIQHMRAGTGVRHSEFNASPTDPAHFLQIWIIPAARGLAPGYGQLVFDPVATSRDWVLLASAEGRDGSLVIGQDVDLWVTRMAAGDVRRVEARPGRARWLQVARGRLAVNGESLGAGDAVAAESADALVLSEAAGAELLLFDLA